MKNDRNSILYLCNSYSKKKTIVYDHTSHYSQTTIRFRITRKYWKKCSIGTTYIAVDYTVKESVSLICTITENPYGKYHTVRIYK